SDSTGRRRRSETFRLDRLGDAVVRLYERYAELLPDGPERRRAMATARSVASLPLVGPHTLERLKAVKFAPAFEYIDHGIGAVGAVRGPEALQNPFGPFLDLMQAPPSRTDDVLALRPDALLVRWTHFGTDRAGGGAFERRLCHLWIFGADGLVTRAEQFDGDRDADALARFDELTGGPPAAAAPLRTAETPRRRVRQNAATATVARIDAAVAARDADAIAALHADRMEGFYHTTGTPVGREESLQTFGLMMELPDATSRHEALATLGDSLALFRLSVSGPGLAD